MLLTLKRAVIVTVLLWIMLALGFTFVLVGLGQVFFPYQANGSVVTVQGRPIAARHVGQYFGNRLQYFWGRPSATVSLTTGKPQPYNALNSAPSNEGPTNAVLLHDIQRRIARYLHTTPGLTVGQIPVSLVESSGSGLDPDITVQSALIQVPRVAKYTGLRPARLRQLVRSQVLPPDLGVFGPSRINVVLLNVALYQLLHPQSAAQ
ncbi:MAG: potassium-transporting ATPase subunit C [Sulfobacillus benefaciens]|uniref:Potassium-transporting ATPase KdpC subunit n=1 Tax=Sulfobacillus benefaciens TaxID=453960 RepID=A0A2T2XE88_9FIRM|nr:MAG: potassium-transporting ATPase subunit C [Sulfobacillus benefaciens]